MAIRTRFICYATPLRVELCGAKPTYAYSVLKDGLAPCASTGINQAMPARVYPAALAAQGNRTVRADGGHGVVQFRGIMAVQVFDIRGVPDYEARDKLIAKERVIETIAMPRLLTDRTWRV